MPSIRLLVRPQADGHTESACHAHHTTLVVGYGDEPGAKPSKSSKKQKSSPQAENEDVVMDEEPTSGNSTPKFAKRTKNAEKKAKKRAKKASLG